jgi:hypothetical protein
MHDTQPLCGVYHDLSGRHSDSDGETRGILVK